MHRILLADDHPVVLCALRTLLATDPELDVVGEATDGLETLALAAALHPDLVLLDITMPPSNGIEIAKRLKQDHPDLVVVFLTMHEDEGLLHGALRMGAAGYLVKRAGESEILEAIHAACAGNLYVHPAMARALFSHTVDRKRRASPMIALTPRERDILRLLARGNTNRQVAELLGLSIRTVENHRASLTGKLGSVSRVELIEYAEQHGLLRTEGHAQGRVGGSSVPHRGALSGT